MLRHVIIPDRYGQRRGRPWGNTIHAILSRGAKERRRYTHCRQVLGMTIMLLVFTELNVVRYKSSSARTLDSL